MHEIPVELEKTKRPVKRSSALGMVAASPHKIGDSFSQDTIHAFDSVGLDRFAIGVAIDFSSNCWIDFFSIFALDFLAIAQTVFVKIFWEHDGVVVVAVGVDLELALDAWLFNDLGELADIEADCCLVPTAYTVGGEEMRFSFDDGRNDRLASSRELL
jgi:hypothetical protein